LKVLTLPVVLFINTALLSAGFLLILIFRQLTIKQAYRKRADKKPTNPEIDDQPTENNAEEENISGKSRKDANKYPTMPEKVYENGSMESLTMREIEKLLTFFVYFLTIFSSFSTVSFTSFSVIIESVFFRSSSLSPLANVVNSITSSFFSVVEVSVIFPIPLYWKAYLPTLYFETLKTELWSITSLLYPNGINSK
jgi:hypothetical protein